MNSFLKKLGQVINAGGALVPVLGPLISGLAPKTAPAIQNVSDELPKIIAVVAQMEAVGQAMQLPGAKKLELAVPMVTQILLAAPFMHGKKIQNPALFSQGAKNLTSGIVDLLNSLDEAAVETEPKAA
jgi:hypothetical protein